MSITCGHTAAMKDQQADWTNGATSAIANYVDSARNMAAQTSNVVTGMAQGMENALTNFVTKGKLDFKSLADSIIAEIVRIQMRQAVAGLVGMIGNMFGAGIVGAGAFGGASSSLAGSQAAAATPLGGDYFGTAGTVSGGYASGLFGGVAGARASGGPVDGGKTYLVGEQGPELFVPSSSGGIVPNHALGGGGEISVNVSVVEDASKAGKVDQQRNGRGLDLTVFVDKVKAAVASDITSGGSAISAALERGYGLNRVGRR